MDSRGNIYAAAWLLSYHLGNTRGSYLEALTYYKGYCEIGRDRARRVLRISKGIQ